VAGPKRSDYFYSSSSAGIGRGTRPLVPQAWPPEREVPKWQTGAVTTEEGQGGPELPRQRLRDELASLAGLEGQDLRRFHSIYKIRAIKVMDLPSKAIDYFKRVEAPTARPSARARPTPLKSDRSL
jgi:hypothetical protein